MYYFLSIVGNFIDNMFTGSAANMLDKAMGVQKMSAIQSLTQFTNQSSTFTQFWTIINNALGVVKPFGYALITTYFLMYLFDAAAKDQVTVDSLIKVLIHLVLIIALIKNLDTIVNTLLSISDSLISKFAGNYKDSTSGAKLTGEQIVANWKKNGSDSAMTIWFQSVLISLVAKISTVAITFAAITRAIEVGWRIIFCPIGLANCFEGGANSKGVQYLKTLGVCILSGAAIYITATVGYSLVSGYLGSAKDEGSLWIAVAAMLGTAGATIGVGNKIRDLA